VTAAPSDLDLFNQLVAASPGPGRNAMIHCWCEAVWQDWQHARPAIAALARDLLRVDDHVR